MTATNDDDEDEEEEEESLEEEEERSVSSSRGKNLSVSSMCMEVNSNPLSFLVDALM